jgi:hypothetical protein
MGSTVPRVILAEVQCVTKGCGCHVVSVRIPQSPGSKPLTTVLDRIGHKPRALLSVVNRVREGGGGCVTQNV